MPIHNIFISQFASKNVEGATHCHVYTPRSCNFYSLHVINYGYTTSIRHRNLNPVKSVPNSKSLDDKIFQCGQCNKSCIMWQLQLVCLKMGQLGTH
ncbi:hypothetical protein Hanom_Chr16g01452871 [Helianthus anomalus]